MKHNFFFFFSSLFGRKEISPAETLATESNEPVDTAPPSVNETNSSEKPVLEHKFYTKDELVIALKKIKELGWVENTQQGNDGAVGNILEELLGIPTNNIPMPDATEWELKAQKTNTKSLITLSHKEPEPRTERIVPRILLPLYGWEHEEAGKRYPADEKSFRQTMNGRTFTDRGFKVSVNNSLRRIEVVFDSSQVDIRHKAWLDGVEQSVGLGSLPVTPYWSFNDLFTSIGRKFYNCLYVRADVMRRDGKEFFHYTEAYFLKNVDIDKFVECIENGIVRIEFDARTGHNHGTKMRMYFKDTPMVYHDVQRVM